MNIFFPSATAIRKIPPNANEILVAFHGNRVILSCSGHLPRAFEWSVSGDCLEFGRLKDAACLLVGKAPLHVPETFREVELRFAFTILPEPEQIAVCRARTLSDWRHKRRFCGVCGHELADLATECARKCPLCETVFYPQISPAVTVAVIDAGGRLLLAHNEKFRKGLYSLVSGFVEPGESVESAVHREIREEVGIEVKNLCYAGSQSWPFPNSLLLGFTAEYAGGTLRPDGVEITDARFFSPREMPEVPPPGSLSRSMIDSWLERVCRKQDNIPSSDVKMAGLGEFEGYGEEANEIPQKKNPDTFEKNRENACG